MSISNTGAYLDNEKESKMKVIVRPMVLFSILDHFMRRKKDQKRVIGTFSKTNVVRRFFFFYNNNIKQVHFSERSQIMSRKLQTVIPFIIPNRQINVLSIRKFRTNSTRYIDAPTNRNKS